MIWRDPMRRCRTASSRATRGNAGGDAQNGRGLFIVSQLARAWGREGDETAGWITWFEIDRP